MGNRCARPLLLDAGEPELIICTVLWNPAEVGLIHLQNLIRHLRDACHQ